MTFYAYENAMLRKRHSNQKIWLVMRLTAFFLLAMALQVSARTYSQKIQIRVRNAPLEKVLTQIQEQSGYSILWDQELVEKIHIPWTDINTESVSDALNQCLKGFPLSYSITARTILIKAVARALPGATASPSPPLLPPRILYGQVTDTLGKPLAGVSVMKLGTKLGTITNVQGVYQLPANKGDIIEFSIVGYLTQRLAVGERDEMNVTLRLAADTSLNDFVVVGFGRQKKESVVGAVTTINPDELVQSNMQLSQGFAGRLSGVISVTPSGQPGSNAANFWIRGVATLGSTTPLIFLDGIEISQADMNAIDPSNIQTFSILKDASATALYGARGANGVMLITTKHGRVSDKPKITILAENIISAPTKVVKFTDGVTFMNLYNEAGFNDDPYAVAKYSDDKIAGTKAGLNPYVFPNVDWYKGLFRDYSTSQHVNVNVRGGGKSARYYSGSSLYNEQGLLRNASGNSFNSNLLNQRFNFVNNVDVNVTRSTVMELNLNADFVKYNGPATSVTNLFTEVMRSNPVNFPMVYPTPDTASHIYFGNTTGGFYTNSTFQNPYADMISGYTQSFSSTILANLRVTQQLDFLTQGLSANAIASVKNWSYSSITRSYTPYYYKLDSYTENPANSGKYDYSISQIGTGGQEALSQSGSTDGDRTIYLQASLNYDRNFGKHALTGLLVYQQKEYDINVPGTNITDALPKRNQGMSGRVTYGYEGKYFFEGNFGYTGSENFASGHKWGFFPSVGLGYVVSKEHFFQDLLPAISLFKLRGSYGLAGNDQLPTGRFPYLGVVNLSAGNGYTFGQNFNNTYSGVQITQFANPDIQWEMSHKLNIGTDIELSNGLALSVDVYREMRNKIFQQRKTVPSTVGVGSIPIYANIDRVVNKGIDLSLNYHKQFNKDLFISARGTFTYARNVVKYYDEPSYIYPYLYQVGQPVNRLWGLRAERLFIDQKEVSNNPVQTYYSNVSAGDIKYTDVSHKYDGASQIDNNDEVPMGHPTVPEITYGFGLNVLYKKIDAGLFFQGIANVSFFMNDIEPFGRYQSNVLKVVADDHYSESNQNIHAFYPRLSESENVNNTQNSSWWLRSAAFLRLKNAEAGYNFNRGMRVYIRGENLLTFSSFKLWDPELSVGTGTGNGLGYPPQRTISCGIQLKIN